MNVVPSRAAKSRCFALRRYWYGLDRGAAVRMHLEVEVRMDPVRVAGVADVADRLAGEHLRPGLQPLREGDPGHALALVVVLGREVVVQVDVEVLGAALALEVEHAARARGGDVELDRARLGCQRERVARRHDVVALVGTLAARVAEVIDVARLAEHREDERRHASRKGMQPPPLP